MKAYVIILTILFSLNSLVCQTNKQSECSSVKFGTELDIFPYITGGYYISGFSSFKNYRARLVYANANTPGFILPDGFDKNNMNVVALLFDYFPCSQNELKGLWLGAGFEYWHNNARESSTGIEGNFDNFILTAGTGYMFFLTDNIYLNPWCALHLRAGGIKESQIGNSYYKTNLILPEVSVKAGFIL